MPRADGPSGPALRCGPPYSVKWSRARLPLESGKPLIRRVRNAGEGFVCGPVQLKRLGWTIAVCHASAYGFARMRQAYGSRGRGLSPCVPHALFPREVQKMTGVPWGRTKHGAMTCVRKDVVALFDN